MGLLRMDDVRGRQVALRGAAWAGMCCAAVAWGQATTVVIPQGPLLPAKLGAWSAAPDATPGATASLLQGQTQAILKEDGLVRSAEETLGDGAKTLRLQALEFGDATGAVSAFTFLRSPEMKAVPQSMRAGADEAVVGGRYLLREGVSVVVADASPGQAVSAADLRLLASGLPKISGPKGASPLLPTYLPAKNLVPGSVRYALGPLGYSAMGGVLPAEILGFEKAAEAATAQYRAANGTGTLTLLLFPTPQIAGDRGRAVEAALNAKGEKAGTVKLRREGPLVLLATGGFSAAEAQQLVGDIHLRTELTWNKPMPPEFHTEVRKTASLLMSITVLSGVLGVAAILLGLFLGFGRAWIRVLMGKPAATEPEFLRLDLGSRRAADAGGENVAKV